MNTVYRSWLCSSPFRGNLLQRTIQCDADICLFDLEDSVPQHLKSTAREELVKQMGLPHEKNMLYVSMLYLQEMACMT
ncbi:hypothetical protein MJ904_07500 [Massilia sp. MB5]|uniref:hypothetical protein n=1 Tax=Massilia sp. MB5 TaxID=2919578 RepID=UPI001F0D0FE6|nr:hypothetical protein [Massilia sp. MB5]UMR32011.1 hypothetical protein MJ904_07500 [Massilia sp. MB5]